MRINNLSIINNVNHLPSFGDAYSTKQEKAFLRLMKDIKKDQGYQNGINVAKFYAPSLPIDTEHDTGIGKLTSKEAEEYYKFIKVYAGANASKFAPIGQMTDKSEFSDERQYVGAYNRSALSIGEDNINLFDLASKKYGNILSKEDAYKVVNQHKNLLQRLSEKLSTVVHKLVDFETTLGWQNQENYPVNKVLHKAFDNFKYDKNPNENLVALREEFEEFKNQKEPVDYDDIYTRLALFPHLKDWPWSKVDFFIGFDSDPKIRAEKMPQYEAYKEQYKDEIEFYKFKQFLGHKTMQNAKEIANKEGIEFFGDCPIGFSWPEKQMFPDAFVPNAEVGWGHPALKYYDIANNENSAAHKLFRAKVAHHLNLFDGIRFDVGWQYMNPKLEYKSQHRVEHHDMGNQITDLIEQIAWEIKGDDFDQRKIMYEADANYDDFGIQKDDIIQKLKRIKGLAILSTEEENNDDYNIGWGNAAYLKENLGYHDDDMLLGTSTHDKDGMYACAFNKGKMEEQIGALMRIFKLRPEDGVQDGWKLLKGDNLNSPDHLRKYMTGRLAETTTVKNNFVQLYDLLGKEDKMDYHTGGNGQNADRDYKNRLNQNYISEYHQRIQKGEIGTMIGAQKFRMEHDGTRERNPELYERVQKFDAYLRHPGKIYTRQQADNSKKGNLDIESLSLDEINNLDITA